MNSQEYTEYLLKKKSTLRKIIKIFYLRNTLKYIKGKTIDFGCGIGELLQRLPRGSIGLENNKTTMEYCLKKKLNVKLYLPESDNYNFKEYSPEEEFKTFIMSHVLEHLKDPEVKLGTIFQSCKRLGIERIVIIVPGIKGYNSDPTHLSCIDYTFFERTGLVETEDYRLVKKRYFPINLKFAGKFFNHNEMIIIYDKK